MNKPLHKMNLSELLTRLRGAETEMQNIQDEILKKLTEDERDLVLSANSEVWAKRPGNLSSILQTLIPQEEPGDFYVGPV